MTPRLGAEPRLAQIATVRASTKDTPRLSTAIDPIPANASQKDGSERIEGPSESTDAVMAPEDSVTCLTSNGIPKKMAACGAMASKNANEMLEAKPAILALRP